MGVVWRNRDLRDLETTIRAIPDTVMERLEPAIKEASREGARLMREYINSRGTGYRGHRGRVESGKMLEQVSNTAERVDSTRLQARWGWIKDRERYFLYQENGFRSTMTQQDVAPMHALLDSFIRVRTQFIADVSKAVRK